MTNDNVDEFTDDVVVDRPGTAPRIEPLSRVGVARVVAGVRAEDVLVRILR